MELAKKKTEPAKVVVWGIGEDYDNVYNSIELQILKNNIEIVAFCCREVDKISPTFEEKPLITKNELCKFTFDYIIIANKGSFYSIQKEAYEFIKKENRNVFIISAQIFKIPRFDFVKDIENNDSLLSLISDRERIQGYEVFNWDNCNTTEYSIRDEGFISSYQKCKNFKEKYSQLIKDFSDSEVKKINLIIKKLIDYHDSTFAKKYHYIVPFTNSEIDLIEKIKRNVKENILYMGKNVFSFNNYKQPGSSYFELNTYFFKYGTDFIENKSYIEGKTIIDAGAYIGDSSMVLADTTPCKNVIAFEPSPSNFDRLKQTLKLNHRDDIIPVNVGLGNKSGTLKFLDTSGMGSSFIENLKINSENQKLLDIPVVTLDEYVQEYNIKVGLIKTDLQGYEQIFLSGAKETIKTQKPILILSIYHTFSDFFDIKPFIEKLDCNYKFKIHRPLDGNILAETKLIAEPIY